MTDAGYMRQCADGAGLHHAVLYACRSGHAGKTAAAEHYAATFKAGPGIFCSPSHKMPFYSTSEGPKCVALRGGSICQALL